MTTNQKWIFGIAAIIVIALIYFNWTALKAFFTSAPAAPGSTTTPPAEGSACTTPLGEAGTIKNGVCMATRPKEGDACTTASGASGTIQQGQCVPSMINSNPPPSSNNPPTFTAANYKLTVKNIQGASGYAYVNGQFVVSNSILPYQLQLSSNGYVTSPDVYFQSGNGWIKRSDVVVRAV